MFIAKAESPYSAKLRHNSLLNCQHGSPSDFNMFFVPIAVDSYKLRSLAGFDHFKAEVVDLYSM